MTVGAAKDHGWTCVHGLAIAAEGDPDRNPLWMLMGKVPRAIYRSEQTLFGRDVRYAHHRCPHVVVLIAQILQHDAI